MIKELQVERYISKFTWYFIVVISLYIFISDYFTKASPYILIGQSIFLGSFILINFVKHYLSNIGLYKQDYFKNRTRIIELFMIFFSFYYLDLNWWILSYALGLLIIVSLAESKKKALDILSFIFIFSFLFGVLNIKQPNDYITLTLFLLITIVIFEIVSTIQHDKHSEHKTDLQEFDRIRRRRDEDLKLIKDLEDRNSKMKEKFKVVEQMNEQLKLSLNKYYDFHHISNIVGSIYDINGLLRFINETIIEIIEADFSSIFLFESKRGTLELHISNINNETSLNRLKEKINNDNVFDIIENGTQFVINALDNSEYDFISSDDIKSFICIPISTTKKKYGMIFIESKEYNKFSEENQKLITLIGQQLSTSIENLELYRKMKELAVTDGLTGVNNRLYLQERVSREFRLAQDNDIPVALVIMDIDHFKKINDTYSHIAGDKILKTMASVVKNSIRRTDMIARYGGEEFLVLFPNMTAEQAFETCENIRKKIQNTKVYSGDNEISITISMGIASYPSNGTTEEEVLKAADAALYESKNTGRNKVTVSKATSKA